MKYTMKYLLNVIKEHNLKPDLIEFLQSKGLLEVPQICADPRKRNPQKIRPPPKQVKVTNVETGEVTVFPSVYKCGKALKINPGSLKWHNNRQIAGRHLIEISE